MFKRWKWLVLILIVFFPIQVIANTLTTNEPETEVSEKESRRSNDMLRYKSNQYTQPERNGNAVKAETSLDGYELMAENEELALYVEEESLALKIENKQTGYIWSSGLDANKEYDLNKTWRSMAHSAITIDYIKEEDKTSSESILTNQSDVTLTKVKNGFTASVDFKEAGITIPLEVTIEGSSLVLSVPHSGIEEGENRLVAMRIYPFLGAVEGKDKNGYMFIPDGSGALMRFDEKQVASISPYRAAIYGEDKGFQRSKKEVKKERVKPPYKVTIPVYGVTHGVDHNGFVTILDEGKNFAEIIAYPSGVATDFHWITAKYNYRYQYFQPTSQDMEGFNTFQKEMNEFDIKKRISFLSDEEADYVGMAHTYQQYLIDNDMLSAKKDQVDIRLEFLGGEVKDGLLWDSVYPMTPVKDLPGFVSRLKKENVDNMHVVYRGWAEGGLTGTLPDKFPREEKLGSKDDFEEVHDFFKEKGIPLYYYTDYTKAFEGASGFSGRTDVARKINSEPIKGSSGETEYYYLSPQKALEIAKQDRKKYEENDIANLAVDTSANALFSDFNHHTLRPEAIDMYQEMFGVLQSSIDSIALYRPNDYMLSETDRYLDIPMYSSNYIFVTDTVPFIQIVLKGYIPYYASFSNYHHNPVDEVLRMIEFGAYPSFYLTSEPSHKLMHTPSEDLYTSQFDDWEDEIIEQYEMVKESLGQVEGETIRFRTVHDTGVVEVGYSNGISIFVNYTSEDVHAAGVKIEADGFKVIERGNQS